MINTVATIIGVIMLLIISIKSGQNIKSILRKEKDMYLKSKGKRN